MRDYEKLGAFYLGKNWDPDRGGVLDEALLYDAKDLTTHAVCVGMTGSGKTGLCVSLLEEAAIDGIPAIVIDPKGDIGNLLLTFPDLAPSDFRPWIDEGAAARKGQTPDQYAASTASLWKKGLADWGQDGERIARLRAAADVAIYTPGSNAGLPLKVLRSFTAPSAAILADSDALRERTQATVAGLLGLLGIEADPIRSREYILLANILDRAWREGRDLELASLIREIQDPPFDRIGILDLESFYSSRDRFGLAMSLNNLLASPGFAAWMSGEPLSVPHLLHTRDGRPRVSILSIAHLSDAERMFFVTLLLSEVVAWMRAQPGTTSLRALLYMDEVFGFLPPTANPPSKIPMLTLLKQARAFGLGVVLATQNPVDLDYKALSNAGTWFIGRLQTERDKMRVMDGLEGASAASGLQFDRGRVERILSGLKSRVFLMNNVHEDAPVLFHTRWAMSYLRGPLAREQIRTLMKDRKEPDTSPAVARAVAAAAAPATPDEPEPPARPIVPPKIPEGFLRVRGSTVGEERIVYRPALLGTGRLHFANATLKLDLWEDLALLAPLDEDILDDPWGDSASIEEPEIDTEPESPAAFADLPSDATRLTSYKSWEKRMKDHLYRYRELKILKCRELKATSLPRETEGEFRVRLRGLAHEARDLAVEKLRKKYAPKLSRMQERIRTAEHRVEREEAQHSQQKMSTIVSIGSTLLGALFGRKVASVGTVGRAGTAARNMGRVSKEKGDIARATEKVGALREKLTDLEEEFEEEIARVQDRLQPEELELKEVIVRPRKADIRVGKLLLAWTPWRVSAAGIAEPAFGEG